MNKEYGRKTCCGTVAFLPLASINNCCCCSLRHFWECAVLDHRAHWERVWGPPGFHPQISSRHRGAHDHLCLSSCSAVVATYWDNTMLGEIPPPNPPSCFSVFVFSLNNRSPASQDAFSFSVSQICWGQLNGYVEQTHYRLLLCNCTCLYSVPRALCEMPCSWESEAIHM